MVDLMLKQQVNGSCVAAGFSTCCSVGNSASCYGLPHNCYCDHLCYEYNDCCTDIGSVCAGTFPPDHGFDNGTCAGMNYKSCCIPGTNVSLSCHGSDGVCYCDQSCHFFGDCCTDIEQYCPSVNPSSTLGSCVAVGYDGCCNPQSGVICYGSSGPQCYCDELCFTYNDCCPDVAAIGCLAPTVSPTVNPGAGSCIAAGHLSCCVRSSSNTCTGSNGLCSCSADCYDSGNCCNDISQIGCATPTPTDSPCTAAGYNQCCHPQIYNGSCSGNPPICYCDQLCFSFGDCCSDVTNIGCIEPSVIPPAPNGSCVAKYPTCCQPSANNTCLGYPSNCYCDAQCHNYGDCCDDIADIGCDSVQSSCAGYTSCCVDEDLTCVGYPEPNCYCDQACTLRDDCCYDQSQLKECTEPTIPGPVNNLMAMSSGPNSFYVMWDPPTHPNGVSHYIINVSNYSGEGDNRLRVQLTIQVLEEIVTQLLPFKPYNVTVYGINIDGKGIRRTVINFTQEGIPTQAPDNVRITRSGTTLTVSWSPLSLEAARGFPMYMVQYFPSTNLNQIVTLNTTGTSVTISNVNARISYGVKVAAFTKGGVGSLSKTAYEGGLSSPRSHISVSLVVGVIVGAVAALAAITVVVFVALLLFKRRGRRSGSYKFKKLLTTATANDDYDDGDDDDHDSYDE
uniref:Fibronectin type-III domain-containing protein n=1 Tax=Amphimedon queenslandica TaxID=400682 RepID=A0A1X7VE53_AMPQE